jgi:hypothetical protein
MTTFRTKNLELYAAATLVLEQEHPMTLRQLYYRLVSAGALANSQKEYKRLGNVMTRAREGGEVPLEWIVDHVRATLKPSSWTGLADFAETVRDGYRKDFWASLDHHVEVFVEKDAVAGTVQPVTEEFDIRLHVCRGYSSISFAGEVADLWRKVSKPIFAYYLGDFDPSGFDLERDLREKLERYSGKTILTQTGDLMDAGLGYHFRRGLLGSNVLWERLAVREDDFYEHELVRLPVKRSDMRARAFVEEYGEDCAEVDAIPPTELRQRVREAIEGHIDPDRWARLRRPEELEQQTLQQYVNGWHRES